jgi:3-methyladenine DNA glycosylase AlkC
MATPLKNYFGLELAQLLAKKLPAVHPEFPSRAFLRQVRKTYAPLELKDRVRLISDALKTHLPGEYPEALDILTRIFGEPNPNETGMFTGYYWLMPVGQFIQDHGLAHPKASLDAIHALTQRNTGEYAIRPYIDAHPAQTLRKMTQWSRDKSFHVRRLSSEGLRPRLPWAPKLDRYVEEYAPVFKILNQLKEDPSKFVLKSVANHVRDYLKVNPPAAKALLKEWKGSGNAQTEWVVRHATR